MDVDDVSTETEPMEIEQSVRKYFYFPYYYSA